MPADNTENQAQVLLCGDWYALEVAWQRIHVLAKSCLERAPDYLFQRIGNAASTFLARRLLLEPDFEDAYRVLLGKSVERYLLPNCLLVQLWCSEDDQGVAAVVKASLEPWLGRHCTNLGRTILAFLLPWDAMNVNIMYRHAVHISLANSMATTYGPMQDPALQEWAAALYRNWRCTCHDGKALLHPLSVL